MSKQLLKLIKSNNKEEIYSFLSSYSKNEVLDVLYEILSDEAQLSSLMKNQSQFEIFLSLITYLMLDPTDVSRKKSKDIFKKLMILDEGGQKGNSQLV